MTDQMLRLATERKGHSLVFAFGLAHFTEDSPSIISLLCDKGFSVTHTPTGRDSCALEKAFEDEGVDIIADEAESKFGGLYPVMYVCTQIQDTTHSKSTNPYTCAHMNSDRSLHISVL